VYSNFRWESPESFRDRKSDRGINRWLWADEESNNKQIKSKKNAVAFIEASPAGASLAAGKTPAR